MKLRAFIVFLCMLGSAFALEPYKVGDVLEGFITKDQHEREVRYVPGSVRLLVVSYEMGAGKDANAWLAKQPADFLASRSAMFMADIHGMPGVGRVFALPKMRKYPHTIVLGDDEKLLERHPRKKACLTVFTLDDAGVIKNLRFVDPEKNPADAFAP